MSLTMNFIRQKFEFDQQNLFNFSIVRVGKVNPIQIKSYTMHHKIQTILKRKKTHANKIYLRSCLDLEQSEKKIWGGDDEDEK